MWLCFYELMCWFQHVLLFRCTFVAIFYWDLLFTFWTLWLSSWDHGFCQIFCSFILQYSVAQFVRIFSSIGLSTKSAMEFVICLSSVRHNAFTKMSWDRKLNILISLSEMLFPNHVQIIFRTFWLSVDSQHSTVSFSKITLIDDMRTVGRKRPFALLLMCANVQLQSRKIDYCLHANRNEEFYVECSFWANTPPVTLMLPDISKDFGH
jgi:hypothetical protein